MLFLRNEHLNHRAPSFYAGDPEFSLFVHHVDTLVNISQSYSNPGGPALLHGLRDLCQTLLRHSEPRIGYRNNKPVSLFPNPYVNSSALFLL